MLDCVSFYEEFTTEPTGEHVVAVCQSLACELCGHQAILDHLRRKLDIEPHETTDDGRFTLLTLECLGSCDTGPVALVGDEATVKRLRIRGNRAELRRVAAIADPDLQDAESGEDNNDCSDRVTASEPQPSPDLVVGKTNDVGGTVEIADGGWTWTFAVQNLGGGTEGDGALELLGLLGALRDGAVTDTGRSMAELPVPPRIGRMLLEGARLGHDGRVALAAALLLVIAIVLVLPAIAV